MTRKLIHIDEMVNICGYFYIDHENWCNNGYNCSNKDCEDQSLFDGNGDEVNLYELIRQHYQQFNLKKKRLLKKKSKEYLQKRNDTDFWRQKFNLKYVGKCFSFSCPLAHKAELDDMQELDKELATNFEDDMSAMDADYMVINGVLKNEVEMKREKLKRVRI